MDNSDTPSNVIDAANQFSREVSGTTVLSPVALSGAILERALDEIRAMGVDPLMVGLIAGVSIMEFGEREGWNQPLMAALVPPTILNNVHRIWPHKSSGDVIPFPGSDKKPTND